MAKSVSFETEKKVKLTNSEYKNSSLIGQIDHKNTKEKSKLLAKCFVNSFTKIPPISARNVPKLPKISFFERRKKSTLRIAISKKRRRRRINYSQIDFATDSEKKK